jgi:hypothetical protein
MSNSKFETRFICFFDSTGKIHFEFVPEGFWNREAQARRVTRDHSLILHYNNAPAHSSLRMSQFLAGKGITAMDHRRTLLTWLQLTSGCFQNSRLCWNESVSLTTILNHLWKINLTDILSLDFKNGLKNCPSTGNIVKNWMEITLRTLTSLISAALKIHLKIVSKLICLSM